MLRRTSGLSRPVLKWVSQVAASLGATLSATLIWSAVPHPGAAPAGSGAALPAAPELTSGGKFAARAVHPMAYDGLDTMPLPHVAPAPAHFVLASFDAAPPRAMRRAAWDEAGATAPERRAVRPPRPPVRAEARRAEPGRADAAPAAPPAAPAAVAASMPAAEPAEEGLLGRLLPASVPSFVPGIASTAREAWTVTASAGDALVARVVPRMP